MFTFFSFQSYYEEKHQLIILPIDTCFFFCYCRRPVEERVVHALGKAWHVEVNSWFVCLLKSQLLIKLSFLEKLLCK